MSITISEHFSFAELTRTNVRLPNVPPDDAVVNLKRLSTTILEPMRNLEIPRLKRVIGRIWIDSAYRSLKVNEKVGGSPESAHIEGRAADLVALDREISPIDIILAVIESQLPFDKVIFESPAESTWVHIQIRRTPGEPRRQPWMCLSPGVYCPFDSGQLKRLA